MKPGEAKRLCIEIIQALAAQLGESHDLASELEAFIKLREAVFIVEAMFDSRLRERGASSVAQIYESYTRDANASGIATPLDHALAGFERYEEGSDT